MSKPELQPCIDCGRLCHEVSTADEHSPGCPHWGPPTKEEISEVVQQTVTLVKRIQSYAEFLKNPPPPPSGSASIGPLFDAGSHAACASIGQTLELLLKGEDTKLLQWTEGNEPLRKALGLKP